MEPIPSIFSVTVSHAYREIISRAVSDYLSAMDPMWLEPPPMPEDTNPPVDWLTRWANERAETRVRARLRLREIAARLYLLCPANSFWTWNYSGENDSGSIEDCSVEPAFDAAITQAERDEVMNYLNQELPDLLFNSLPNPVNFNGDGHYNGCHGTCTLSISRDDVSVLYDNYQDWNESRHEPEGYDYTNP